MFLYLLSNTITSKRYVGITTGNVQDRWIDHQSDARKGSPYYLHRAVVKHGSEAFQVLTLAEAPDLTTLKALEVDAIERLKTFWTTGTGYNLTRGGDGVFGFLPTAEQRAALSVRSQAYWSSPEARQFQSAVAIRYWSQPGIREKHQRQQSERWADPLIRETHRLAMVASTASPEIRQSLSERSRAYWDRPGARGAQWIDPEQRRQRSDNQKALWANPEYRSRMLAARKR